MLLYKTEAMCYNLKVSVSFTPFHQRIKIQNLQEYILKKKSLYIFDRKLGKKVIPRNGLGSK